MTLYNRTIDWDRYWDEKNVPEAVDSSPSAEHIVDPLLRFIDKKGRPDRYADVGCGAGAAVFSVAEAYPETTVIGYDSAEAVLEANREFVRQQGLTNVEFNRAVLPAFETERQFDIVSSFFTLCYVADVERALRNLYDAVAPGGYLVVTYHNQYAQSLFRKIADSPHEHLDEASTWDPDRFADRFQLVLDGRSLLSYDRIHDVLGTWPQSVWSITENFERYGAWRQNPLVYIPK